MSDPDPGSAGAGRTASYVALAAGMAAFGSATPVSKLVGDDFPIWLAGAGRMLFALAVLAPLSVWWRSRRGERSPIAVLRESGTADRWLLALVGVVGTFGFSVAMYAGMRRTDGTAAAVIMALTPALTALGAWLVLSERFGWRRALATALAVTGVVVVTVVDGGGQGGGGGGSGLLGPALVLVAVACETTYSLAGKRLGADLDPITLTAVAAAIALVCFAPLAAAQAVGLDWGAADTSGWFALVWWGVGTMALGSVLWFWGMRRVDASVASPFMGVMPVSALLLSYAVLGEEFEWIQPIGMLTVLASIALVVSADRRDAER